MANIETGVLKQLIINNRRDSIELLEVQKGTVRSPPSQARKMEHLLGCSIEAGSLSRLGFLDYDFTKSGTSGDLLLKNIKMVESDSNFCCLYYRHGRKGQVGELKAENSTYLLIARKPRAIRVR